MDSEPRSWNMDPALLEQALGDRIRRGTRPKAVIVVHLYGQPADMDAILSFNGNKIITTGGGGMLLGHSAEEIARVRALATQAREPAPHYEHTHIGHNYRLSNIAAAIGRRQLTVLDDRVARRRAIFDHYVKRLGSLPGIAFMPEPAWGRGNCWLTCLTVDPALAGFDRETLRLALERENIESRPLWKPMHLQPVFAQSPAYLNGISESLFTRGLCLPLGTVMSEEDLERVVTCALALSAGRARAR